jgi:exodeoxyribonuclease VII large subunit
MFKDLEGLKKRLSSPGRLIENHFQKCDDLIGRLTVAVTRNAAGRRKAFEHLLKNLETQNPSQKFIRLKEEVLRLFDRLAKQVRHEIALKHQEVETLLSGLNSLGPVEILKRGYSITRKLPGQSILKSSREVLKGDWIEIILADGKVRAKVTEIVEG